MLNNKNNFKIYIKMLILFVACIFSADYNWSSNIIYYIEIIQKDINLIIYIYIKYIYEHKYI